MSLLFSFTGRIGRLTYFTASLCAGIVIGILYAIAVGAGSQGSIPAVAANVGELVCIVLFLWIVMALAVKRCHDLGQSGWWSLLQLIPYVGLAMSAYLMFIAGVNETNEWGPPAVPRDEAPSSITVAQPKQ
jgi:uncharacterized membrane protein YhaH (DUF805 family)